MNFAVQHLLGAARLAREVDSVERANAPAEFGAFFDEVLSSSVGVVVLAAASAESYANELFADRAAHFANCNATDLDQHWKKCERKPVLDKFAMALRLKAGLNLQRQAEHVKSLACLFQLRNAVMHFKPEWFGDADGEHAKLAASLNAYAGRSPWLPDEPLFPRAWATTVTTSWAVATVKEFVARFSADSGIEDRLAQFSTRLKTTSDDDAGPRTAG